MFPKLLAINCFLILQIAYSRTSLAPVLLWGIESPSKPALPEIKQAEFVELLRPLLEDHALVAFVETGLTTKDFVCRNPNTKASCYGFLQRQSPRTYFAKVEGALGALQALGGTNISTLSDRPASCEAGRVTLVNLGEGDGERWRQLEAHDAVIAGTVGSLNCSVLFLYLSSTPPLVRPPRRVFNEKNLFITAAFSMYFEDLVVRTTGDDASKEQVEVLAGTAMTPTPQDGGLAVVLTLNNSKNIEFQVTTGGDYYTIERFVYDGVIFPTSGVLTPTKMSYFCGDLRLANKSSTLTWHSLQFQGATKNLGDDPKARFKFYEAWHCVGFVTPAIIAGIFVMVLIALITLMGVCWMMDIKTNDRFDDPKGNTISVTLEE